MKADLNFRFPLPRKDGTVTICQLDCLPFGWDKSPVLGQAIHQQLVNEVATDSTDSSVYIDDGLALDDDIPKLETFTAQVLHKLDEAGFVMCIF